jgi:alpha-glucosidase
VTGIPDAARRDPTFRRTGGAVAGRDGSRVPLPWDRGGDSFGFSRTGAVSTPAPPWLPQPPGWGECSVAVQSADPASFLRLYREALRIRRAHPALGSGPGGAGAMRWLPGPDDALLFARDPGFVFAANLGAAPLRLPPHREILLASGPLTDEAAAGWLPPGAGAWVSQ